MAGDYQEEPLLYRHGSVRVGGCTAGCGACCEFLNIPLDRRLLDAPADRLADWRHWVELHGILVYESGEGDDHQLVARIQSPCKHLTDDKRCAVFGEPERPQLCRKYPLHPLDLEGVEDRCTYIWEPLGGDPPAARKRARERLAERLKEAAE